MKNKLLLHANPDTRVQKILGKSWTLFILKFYMMNYNNEIARTIRLNGV